MSDPIDYKIYIDGVLQLHVVTKEMLRMPIWGPYGKGVSGGANNESNNEWDDVTIDSNTRLEREVGQLKEALRKAEQRVRELEQLRLAEQRMRELK